MPECATPFCHEEATCEVSEGNLSYEVCKWCADEYQAKGRGKRTVRQLEVAT